MTASKTGRGREAQVIDSMGVENAKILATKSNALPSHLIWTVLTEREATPYEAAASPPPVLREHVFYRCRSRVFSERHTVFPSFI